ncbi:hypothetical protein ACFLQ8_03595 [Candidatus Auribacterota bacterium]
MKRTLILLSTIFLSFLYLLPVKAAENTVVDTGQEKCYDNTRKIPYPKEGKPFYGQDAQYISVPMAYKDNGDGTVTDLNTGLMWSKAVDDYF